MIDNTTLRELKKEAEESVQQLMEQHNKAYHYYWDCPWAMKQLGKKEAALYDKEVTADDYAIFIRPNGYAVMLRKAYEKLSARDKKKLINGCTFVSV